MSDLLFKLFMGKYIYLGFAIFMVFMLGLMGIGVMYQGEEISKLTCEQLEFIINHDERNSLEVSEYVKRCIR